ncbi:MAG: hypothetical protein K0Q77_2237 [Anaerosporomusa subterranea]|nr:hypothetical protein [Anaerosporomusa subterranea]
MNPLSRQKTLVVVLVAVCLVVLLPGAAYAAEGDTVQTIRVDIAANPPATPRVLRRIEASVKTVGQRLLVGKETELISQSHQTYEALMQEVLDRVLAGYSVQQVAITPGVATKVAIVLEPWGERVRAVQVNIEFSAVDKLFIPLLRDELGDLAASINGILLGLPVDSLEWADTVAKNSIRELVEARLPEYRAAVDIMPGEQTQVRLVFSPVGVVVREAVVSLRSDSMPNLLLYEMKPEVETFAKALRGLPTEFVVRKQRELTNQLEQIALVHPYTQSYLLNVRGELIPGPDTQIHLQLESRKYRVNAEARLDMGRDNANTSGHLHAGKFVSPEDELFVEVELSTNTMQWQFSPGWGRRIGPNTVVGARFNVTDNSQYAWLEHRFGENWRLRFDRSSEKDDDEIGLRYKLHDFLSAELVHRPHENFIRVIGQL